MFRARHNQYCSAVHSLTTLILAGSTERRVARSHRSGRTALLLHRKNHHGRWFHQTGDNLTAGDPSEQARFTAVKQLKALGLSTDAARTLVALVSLGEGTAQDVNEATDVPRTRVSDAADELRNRGFVEVRQSSPKRYWAISTETAGRHFEQEYEHRVTALTAALDSLETTTRTTEQRGVWTVVGRDTVCERVVDFVSTGDDEVVYTTTEEGLTEAIGERRS